MTLPRSTPFRARIGRNAAATLKPRNAWKRRLRKGIDPRACQATPGLDPTLARGSLPRPVYPTDRYRKLVVKRVLVPKIFHKSPTILKIYRNKSTWASPTHATRPDRGRLCARRHGPGNLWQMDCHGGGIGPVATPCSGAMARKIQFEHVHWSCGADGLAPRHVPLDLLTILASICNQLSIG